MRPKLDSYSARLTQTGVLETCYNTLMAVIHKTYQVRAYANAAGYDCLDRVLRNCAVLYNAALQEWKSAYRYNGHALSVSRTRFDQMKELTGIRKDDPEFWGAISLQIARGVLVRLDRARQAFFRRVRARETPGYPRFKSSRRWRSIEIAETRPSMVRGNGKHYMVRIKGLPTIRLRSGRELPDTTQLKALTITKRGRRLWVNLTYTVEQAQPNASGLAVGIDMGVTNRITLSTGEAISRRNKPNNKMRRGQQRLARCRKGSRRWRERRAVLSSAQDRERIRNRNECHRITTGLVRRFGLIAAEKLQIKNMTTSAKGTVENPGTNVRQKSGLNRSIAEQTWGVIRQQLAYKAEWAGRELAAVNPKHTSQTCSDCGILDPASRDGKNFCCRACGVELDADVNAAVNILKRAMARGNKAGHPARAAALDAA